MAPFCKAPAIFSTGAIPLVLNAAPDLDEALGYLGYDGQNLSDGLLARLYAATGKCAALKPRGVFRVFDRDCVALGEEARVRQGSSRGLASRYLAENQALALPGEDIARHLEGASAVAVLAVTLGYESERLIRRETALSATDGLLLDAVASAMAEDAVRTLHECVKAWAAECGLRAGSRFSPGYGDLSLEVQPDLLTALDAARLLGISVTDAHLLVPAKSITAIVGLFEQGELSQKDLKGSFGALDESRFGMSAPFSATSAPRTCKECTMAGMCLFEQQGRTCHGSRRE